MARNATLARKVGEPEDAPYRKVTGWYKDNEWKDKILTATEATADYATLWGLGGKADAVPVTSLTFCPSDVWLGKVLGVKEKDRPPELAKKGDSSWQDLI